MKNQDLTLEEKQLRIEIIEYLLTHRDEVNYTDRIFTKLENKLNEYKGGK